MPLVRQRELEILLSPGNAAIPLACSSLPCSCLPHKHRSPILLRGPSFIPMIGN